MTTLSKTPDFFNDAKNAKRYTVDRVLGSGAYASVYKAMDNDRKKNVAVKQILKNKKASSKPFAEYAVGKQLRHPNIVKTREFSETATASYIVYDMAADGDMFDRLDPKGPGLTESQARKWVHELASALQYMHSKKIVHRDVKPENILVHKGHVQLCDFGLAAHVNTKVRGRAPGTGAYMAPELLDGTTKERIVTEALDVWSFGIVVFAVLFADLPWEAANMRDPDYRHFVSHGGVNSSEHPYSLLSSELVDMLGRLLAVDPAERCSMKEAVKFFSKVRPWFAEDEVAVKPKVHKELADAPPLYAVDSCSSIDSIVALQ